MEGPRLARIGAAAGLISMNRAVIDEVARDTIGRSLEEGELQEILRAAWAMNLSANDVWLRQLVLQQLVLSALRDIQVQQRVFEKGARAPMTLSATLTRYRRHIAIAGALVLISVWAAYKAGRASSYDIQVRRDHAEFAWLGTEGGHAARALYDAGAAERLANCNMPGWRLDGGACFPRPNSDGKMYGYRLPASPRP